MPSAKEIITSQILSSLEKGVAPWTKPWTVNGHKNLGSKRPYRGINRLLLETYAIHGEYTTTWWTTYQGAKRLGGNVKKDEKHQKVVLWKPIVEKNDKGEEEQTGVFMRYYKVWNADQCEGIEIPEKEELDFVPKERAEAVIKDMPNPPSFKSGGDSAYYVPSKDHVQVPFKNQFKDVDSYYCTAFHELTHSTGHKDRCDRPDVMKAQRFGNMDYSKEELIAEIGAAMLGAYCDFDPSNVDRSASYVKHWLNKLDDDPNMVISAAGKAQKAYDYILDGKDDEDGES